MHWSNLSISPDTRILDALQIIENCATQLALIVDQNNILLGVVTDGDVRRGILSGVSLQDAVSKIMNVKPITALAGEPHHNLLSKMKHAGVAQIPIIDASKKVMGVRFLKEFWQPNQKNNIVILMAGGKGRRLRPLTDNCPKPLLKIGDKPILQTVIERFEQSGFDNFYLAVHQHAEKIQDYFQDGSEFGVKIQYLYEPELLGTAGALSLLPEKPTDSFIVMNADLITNIDFSRLLEFHKTQKASATVCVQSQEVQIPFGVVNLKGSTIASIEEKPVHRYLASAGIYVLEPHVLQLVPDKKAIDMPELLDKLINSNNSVSAFALHEDWLDIGRPEDFKTAQKLYSVI